MGTDAVYNEIIRIIEGRGIMPKRAPALDVTQEGLRRIGFGTNFKFPAEKVIVVAGTNGKGSVCATLEALLLSAGQRTGLYTSPHLVDTTERIRIAGKDIDRATFCRAFEEVDSKIGDLQLSHFETLTLMAIWLFASGEAIPCVDWIILEVGLGGTWDSTNAIPHHYSVITSISMDHESILGPTLVDIARNKFGIIGKGGVVAHTGFAPELSALIQEVKEKTLSRWYAASEFTYRTEGELTFVTTKWGEAQISLPGLRGAQNTTLALEAFQILGFDVRKHLPALARVRWPGRMEKFGYLKSERGDWVSIYLSGDHNPQGVESLLEILKSMKYQRVFLLIGIGVEKNVDEMMRLFCSLPTAKVYLTRPSFKGRTREQYGKWLSSVEGFWEDPVEALEEMKKRISGPQDLVVVSGSLYLVGEVRKARNALPGFCRA